MANLTITVDETTLKRARMRALQRDESVNAYLAEALRRYAAADDAPDRMAGVLRAARASTSGSGAEGRTWTREELHRG
ncbi:hypothetical protein [Propioniciclava sp.]|uniref:hypothetical protein n=1 Tax=Propioniciclava sp. TaxID=2038686 RepID=UPI00260CFB77|nr:hypothetical protein [Propioniciclava sp.]